MPNIQILPTLVADMIAAGEVVERPGSVVKELMENAIDAGAKNITIELRAGGTPYIRVTDDGCGIPQERMKGLFTGHLESTAPVDTGRSNMGIGLSVCSAIVRAHGSEMQAENRPQGGAEFRFALEMEEEKNGE